MAVTPDPDNAVSAFLSFLAAERGAAQNTLDAYRRDLADYEAALGRTRNPLTAKRDDIERYMAGLSADGFAASTRARRLSSIKQLHAFLFAEGWRDGDPAAPVKGPGKSKALPRTLSVEEVSALLSAAATGKGLARVRRVCLMELLYASGLRVTELVSLPVSAVRRNPAMIPVRGKGDKDRLAPLSDRARAALAAYLPERDAALNEKSGTSPWLFPSRGKSGHLTRARFFQMLREVAIAANLDPTRVSPHTLRHAFATHLLANGADLRVIQTLLGHADISTTEIYTHVMDKDLQTLVQEKHPLAVKKGRE